MSAAEPNVFNALFKFRSREEHSPEENFLTEGFAHILRTADCAREAWLSLVFNTPLPLSPAAPEIQTRNSETDEEEDCNRMPDLKILASSKAGDPIMVFSEHKWNSPFDPGQLQSYARIAKKTQGTTALVFIGAHLYQVREAKKCATCVPCRAMLWEDVYLTLSSLKSTDTLLKQFLSFMKAQGLSPGEPITLRKMQAYVESSDFIAQLFRYAGKLMDYDWSILPNRYRQSPEVRNRWGRVAVEFPTPNRAPTITTGFLYSTEDHEVSFTSPGKGIDLFLRVECNPGSNPKPDVALSALASKADDVRKLRARVLLRGERGNGNRHTLLIAQRSVDSVVGPLTSEQEQVDAIYEALHSWAEALFGDGKLEPKLQGLNP